MRWVFLWLWSAACGHPTCDLAANATGIAGADALVCGDVEVDGDPSAMFACLADAWEAGTPAVGSRRLSGFDSVITQAVVFDGADVWSLTQDSYGGPGGEVLALRCVGVSWEDELVCDAWEPESTAMLVCGCSTGDGRPQAFPGRDLRVTESRRYPGVFESCAADG
jgi:hypothetical protein